MIRTGKILNEVITRFVCALLDFVYPQYCKKCNVLLDSYSENSVCLKCLKEVEYVLDNDICSKCGMVFSIDYKVADKNLFICRDCHNLKIYFHKARHIAKYDGVIKILINEMKYRKKTKLKKIFADLVVRYLYQNKDLDYRNYDYITYVPMHKKERENRGFNQSALIASQVALKLNKPLKKLLSKIKETKQQAGLPRKERRINIKGCFTVEKNNVLKNKKILLIDDVFTTGTTINECSKIIKRKTGGCVDVITIARGQY